MKNPTIKLLVIGLVGLGVIFTNQLSTAAASQYSAARSNDVKLIWRRSMGRHAYTATTGARYSEHLGVRYGYNSENSQVVWYTTAHEKLYFKDSHTYAIYYHVTNTDQSLQGWIWNGYLKPTSTSSGTTGTPNNSGATNSGNSPTATPTTSGNKGTATNAGKASNTTSNSGYSDNAQEFNNTDNLKFAQQIIQLSPNMVEDEKLDDLAKYDLWTDDHYNYGDAQTMFNKYLVKLYGGEPYGLLEDWGAVVTPDANLVKEQQSSDSFKPINYATLSKYDGYHIGVATEAWSPLPSGKIQKIKYVIWILPANPTINPVN